MLSLSRTTRHPVVAALLASLTVAALNGALVGSAQAAVVGSVAVNPTSGTDQTGFGGTATTDCPATTTDAYWSVDGPDLPADTAILGDGVGSPKGDGAQAFSGASVANLKSANSGSFSATGAYKIKFNCVNGSGVVSDTYEATLNYTAGGSGAWTITGAVVGTVPGAPGTPSGTPGNTSVQLSWSAPASNGGAAISGYDVQVLSGGVQVKVVAVTGTSTTVTGLTNGTAYTFKVRAKNSEGAGAYSTASSALTPKTVPSAPAKPGVSAPTTGGAVKVTWTAPGNGGSALTGYIVKGYAGATLTKTVAVGNVLTTTVTGLTNGTSYTFRVAARNAVGTGAQSVASNAVAPRIGTKLLLTSAPSQLTYGVAPKVVGKLTRIDGTTAVGGQAVTLQVRKKGTATYVNVSTVNTVSTGYVTFTAWKPAYPVDALRLVKSTAGAYLGSVSAAKAVSTQRRITTKWSSTQIYLGKTSTLSGYVYPKASGLRITLQRKSGTSWVTVTYRTLPSTTAGYSSYAFSVKPAAKGTHYYRVVVGAGSNYVASVANAPALKVV